MRSLEDKDVSGNANAMTFEFHKGNGPNRVLGKATPSKWDDAQKWLMGLSRGVESRSNAITQPRDSNADDRRLIAPVPQKEQDYSSSEEGHHGPETKNMDCDEYVWRVNASNKPFGVRSVCVRDMGTEMTPIASQEPSRTATPVRSTTPVRSPISSGPSTPARPHEASPGPTRECRAMTEENGSVNRVRKLDNLETRAEAWDEAERAKYTAKYKREEVKIRAWENHEQRKAEMEMKKLEVKAERLKARAQEKVTNKLSATRRQAEEKRANAEAKMNEMAVKTSEKADYIRRTGHVPSSFSFKLPSLCW